MNSFTVLRDVGDTIKNLFREKIPELSDENSILYNSPGEMESDTITKLSVFLFQIDKNPHLANSPQELTGEDKFRFPSLALDLRYLFTPYSQNRETEFIILERIMQLFHDYPILRGEQLQGSLQSSGNEEIRSQLLPLSVEECNKLWGLFPGKTLKLSLAYQLTPIQIPSSKQRDVTFVEEKGLKVGSLQTLSEKERNSSIGEEQNLKIVPIGDN